MAFGAPIVPDRNRIKVFEGVCVWYVQNSSEKERKKKHSVSEAKTNKVKNTIP